MEQRSDEWFKARKGRITGSVVGAILGYAPYMSRDDVMRSMVRSYHNQANEFTGNAATQWGTVMEETAKADFEITTGHDVEDAPFVQWDEDWLGASPDGYVGDDELLEIKCPYGLRNQSPTIFKSIDEQPHYYAQIQIQLLVTERVGCYFFQWSPHGNQSEYVPFDPEWINENLPKLREFYAEYLNERDHNAWKHIDGGEFSKRYKLAKAALEVAKVEMEEAKEALINATDGKGGKIGDITVTRVAKKGNISYQKALKELAPNADLEVYRGKDSEYWRIS
jgi:putative phage-type endonuclease